MSSTHVHKFAFQIGPIKYEDEIPSDLWSKVPESHKFRVKKNLRDSLENKLKEHMQWCTACKTGWWNPLSQRLSFPCPVFSLSFSIIRKMWRDKLVNSVRILMQRNKVKGLVG